MYLIGSILVSIVVGALIGFLLWDALGYWTWVLSVIAGFAIGTVGALLESEQHIRY